jgi:hypothetical protein
MDCDLVRCGVNSATPVGRSSAWTSRRRSCRRRVSLAARPRQPCWRQIRRLLPIRCACSAGGIGRPTRSRRYRAGGLRTRAGVARGRYGVGRVWAQCPLNFGRDLSYLCSNTCSSNISGMDDDVDFSGWELPPLEDDPDQEPPPERQSWGGVSIGSDLVGLQQPTGGANGSRGLCLQ